MAKESGFRAFPRGGFSQLLPFQAGVFWGPAFADYGFRGGGLPFGGAVFPAALFFRDALFPVQCAAVAKGDYFDRAAVYAWPALDQQH